MDGTKLAAEIVSAVRKVTGPGQIPLHRPFVTEGDMYRVHYTDPIGYDAVEKLEAELREFTGAKHAIAVSSGTAALHLALLGVGVLNGHKVAITPMEFAGAAAAIMYCGASPRFGYADGTAASITVHLLGTPTHRVPDTIRPIIEDAAAALGSFYEGQPCGGFNTAGIFSFNNNKIVTTGGGGAVMTNDTQVAARVRHLATTAKKPSPFFFEHDAVGFNYRMGNMGAALGIGQMLRLMDTVTIKRRLRETYAQALGHLEPDVKVCIEGQNARSNYWLNAITVRPEYRDTIMEALWGDGISCRALYTPLHLQAPYRGYEVAVDSAAEAERLFATTICLPSGRM